MGEEANITMRFISIGHKSASAGIELHFILVSSSKLTFSSV